MRDLRSSGPFDYIVGSVHDVDGHVIDSRPEQTESIAAMFGGKEQLQLRYFDALTDLIVALKPEIVGHIDLVRKFEPEGFAFGSAALHALERTLEAAKAFGCVLDVNCGAYRRGLGPVYPLPSILERARRMGIRVTLGDDSHGVSSVGVGLDACIKAITDVGYSEISYLDRDGDAVVWRNATIEDTKPENRA
jgi:histidinol-phosphatase (PHP family)